MVKYRETFYRRHTDMLIHPPSMARVLVYPSLDNLEVVEGDQRNLIRLHHGYKIQLFPYKIRDAGQRLFHVYQKKKKKKKKKKRKKN